MTPERAKMLEMLVVDLTAMIFNGYVISPEVSDTLAALSSLPAEPADAGEMVEVWGYVRTNPKGFVDGRVDTDEKYIRDRAAAWSRTENGPVMGTVFTARIPRPVVPEVEAEVEA